MNAPTSPSNALPLPEMYYQDRSRTYWRRDNSGRFFACDAASARAYLRASGIPGQAREGEQSPLDRAMLQVQEAHRVNYIGPLAGYSAGIYRMNGDTILVTSSPRLIEPQAGDWPMLQRILGTMLPDDAQRLRLMAWIKHGVESLRSGNRSPGPVLVLAGPVRSGKTLLVDLITEILGGRSAYPYQAMTEGTPFNEELFHAEHLVIDDQAESTQFHARKQLGGAIKQVAVTYRHRCHAKRQTPVTLQPFWRMTICLNDTPERMMILPPYDPDYYNKILMLKVSPAEIPMPTRTPQERTAFWTALQGELPAFLEHLLAWEIPEKLLAERTGIHLYHHPDLVSQLIESTPEQELLELIDTALFSGPTGGSLIHRRGHNMCKGTAAELMTALMKTPQTMVPAKGFLRDAKICGRYLGRLEEPDGSRVTSIIRNGRRIYTILPPCIEEMDGDDNEPTPLDYPCALSV